MPWAAISGAVRLRSSNWPSGVDLPADANSALGCCCIQLYLTYWCRGSTHRGSALCTAWVLVPERDCYCCLSVPPAPVSSTPVVEPLFQMLLLKMMLCLEITCSSAVYTELGCSCDSRCTHVAAKAAACS